jgi:putative flippase GtrA
LLRIFEKICVFKSASVRKVSSFIFVGCIGFAIDGGLLTLLTKFYLYDIYFSRLISFSAAAFITWLLNRTYIFKYELNASKPNGVEYICYLLVQLVGALANLLVFTFLMATYPLMEEILIIPLFIGAIFGLTINFAGANLWVFKMQKREH